MRLRVSELADVREKVGSIDANVKILLKRSEHFDNRLRTVEQRQWWTSGAAAVVGFFVSHFTKGHIG